MVLINTVFLRIMVQRSCCTISLFSDFCTTSLFSDTAVHDVRVFSTRILAKNLRNLYIFTWLTKTPDFQSRYLFRFFRFRKIFSSFGNERMASVVRQYSTCFEETPMRPTARPALWGFGGLPPVGFLRLLPWDRVWPAASSVP